MLVATEYTIDSVNKMIWDAVGGDEDRTLKDALRLVHQELLDHGDHAALWEAFGLHVLKDVEQRCRTGETVEGHQRELTEGRSWRARYTESPEAWLEMLWPIGIAGRRKALGDWTGVDYEETARWYGQVSNTYASRRDLWTKTGKIVGDKTTKDVLAEIPEEFIAYVCRGTVQPAV